MMSYIKKIMIGFVDLFFKLLFLIGGKPKFSKNLQKAIFLYKKDGFGKLFAKIRAWDSPYEEIEKLVPVKGKIVDLGCGDGLLVNYLAISSPKRSLVGIELNRDRILIANKGIKNTFFKKADIIKEKLSFSDMFLLIHVFHHLSSFAEQEKLLDNISRSLKKGNKLLILEIDNKPILKYIFSWLTDIITVPILFNEKLLSTKIYYRTRMQWKKLLEDYGFEVTLKSIHKKMPFSHVILVATKK